jgi:hypothetical protein
MLPSVLPIGTGRQRHERPFATLTPERGGIDFESATRRRMRTGPSRPAFHVRQDAGAPWHIRSTPVALGSEKSGKKVYRAMPPRWINERHLSSALEQLVAASGDFSTDLFARGYIFCDRRPIAPAWWVEDVFAGFRLKHDPRLNTTRKESGGVAILCLGIIFDTRNPKQSQIATVDGLVAALDASEGQFLRELGHTGGRYVVIYRRSGGPAQLLTDATGMRCALYYHQEAKIVASHAGLAQLNGEKATPPAKPISGKFGLPGLKTTLQNVHILTPNTKLPLNTFKPVRYWPTFPLAELRTEEAADLFGITLKNSFEWLSSQFTTVSSLTGGMDSRVTLAIAKHRTTYFTYYRGDSADTDAADLAFAQQAANELGLSHTVLDGGLKAPQDFRAVQKINAIYQHLPNMVYKYKLLFQGDSPIHIRSNLSEIGRMFYKYQKVYPRSASTLMRLWTTDEALRNDANVLAFDEFAERTQFFDAPVERTSLFYWEHRMGCWHSQVATEGDPAFESVSLYNCRRTLELMLSVPAEAQKSSEILRRTIVNEWPALANYPVNGKPFVLPSSE